MKTTLLSLLLAVSPLLTASHACGAYGATEDALVAHEWGTFTSVQGADGIPKIWNPYTAAELPTFVYNHSRALTNFGQRAAFMLGKVNFSALQRMETPVIYFYANHEQTVDVSVNFPQGIVTEWYPKAQEFSPATFTAVSATPRSDSFIHWNKVRVTPASQATTHFMLREKSGSHYYAARETDAAMLTVGDGSTPPQAEQEKFLFYRGLGQFASPFKVTITPNPRMPASLEDRDLITVENSSGSPIPKVFVYRVDRDSGMFTVLDQLKDAPQSVKWPQTQLLLPKMELIKRMSTAMEKALMDEGLFPKEAAAMVATWRDSWFTEEGTRLFYLMPRKSADAILPLEIKPQPSQTVRVFVGRAEVITREVQSVLRNQITRFGNGQLPRILKAKAVQEGRDLGLGRFTAPAIAITLGDAPPQDYSKIAWDYYNAVMTTNEFPNTVSAR